MCTEPVRWLVMAVVMGSSVGLGGCGGTASVSNDPPASEAVAPPSVSAPATENAAARPTSAAVEQLINRTLRSTQDISYSDVVDLLGPPLRTTHRTVANAYATGQIDTVRTLYYPALQAQVYTRSHDTRSFLIQIRVLAPFYATPSGLRVEMERAAVRQQMGTPQRVENEVWVYENVRQDAADVRLSWTDDRVSAITYVFHFS